MDGPRELIAYLLQSAVRLVAAASQATNDLALAADQATTNLILTAEQIPLKVLLAVERMGNQFILGAAQMEQAAFETLPMFVEFVTAMASDAQLTAVAAAYWLYIWTDAVGQLIHVAADLSPSTAGINEEVPGGIAVWLAAATALAIYAVVYRWYPSHEDWVSTMLSILFTVLSRALWRSD